MPIRPWTLDDVPPEYRLGWWEAKNAQVVDGKVAFVPDWWGLRAMNQSADANRPTYQNVSGYPAMVWPNGPNNLSVRADAPFAPVWWILVMQYRTGAEAAFGSAEFPSLINGGNNASRVMGSGGTAILHAQNTGASTASKNAAAYAATVLPMPRSLVSIRTIAQVAWGLGLPSATGRGWQGPIWAAVALSVEPAGDLLARIEGRLAWDYGIQDSLPADHAYRNAPPTEGQADAITGTGAAVLPALIGSATGAAILSGSGASDLPSWAGAGAGAAIAAGQGGATLSALIGAASGSGIIAGIGAAMFPNFTGAGTGTAGLSRRGRVATAAQSRTSSNGPNGRRISAGNDGTRHTRA